MLETVMYEAENVITFLYTTDKYGGFSNLCKNYPIYLKKVYINSSEALYQAMKYTKYSDIQKKIIKTSTPKESKIESRKYNTYIREDWENIKVEVMMWCLRIKLLSNWIEFGKLLHTTKNLPIIEISYRDQFWGAEKRENTYVGKNILGKLLVKLREEYRANKLTEDYIVEPPKIKNFKLYNCDAKTLILTKEEKKELLEKYINRKYVPQKLF